MGDRRLKRRLLVAVATLGPLGRVPAAPGTAGSLAAWLPWVLLSPTRGPTRGWMLWGVLCALALAAVGAAGEAVRALGTADPPEVVIDEVVGMATALALVQPGLAAAIVAFAAFRAFDVAKPFPVRQAERLPGGWGIVADDVVAGLYAAGAVRLAWWAFGAG